MITRILSPDNSIILAKGENYRGLGIVEKIVPAKNGKHYAVTASKKTTVMSIDNWGNLVEIKNLKNKN
jgi:uncharacterized protein YkvS